jgi:hypothetical protein
MRIEEFLLVYEGFGSSTGVSHVVRSMNGRPRVLVGDPEDNPGTSVTNALERVAATVSEYLLDGRTDFDLYEFVPQGPLGDGPTFFRIDWKGGKPFSMPTWHRVSPTEDSWLPTVSDRVRARQYSVRWIRSREEVSVVDGRRRLSSSDPLGWLLD